MTADDKPTGEDAVERKLESAIGFLSGLDNDAMGRDPDDGHCYLDEMLSNLDVALAAYRAGQDQHEQTIADMQEQHRLVMDEKCPSDEVHCTCVPILRVEIERLKMNVGDIAADARLEERERCRPVAVALKRCHERMKHIADGKIDSGAEAKRLFEDLYASAKYGCEEALPPDEVLALAAAIRDEASDDA